MSFPSPHDELLSLQADSARRLFTERYPLSHRRRRIEARALDRAMWRTFGEMGWIALPLPEEAGGLGLSPTDAAPLLQALGRHLVLEPYVDLVIGAAVLLARAGSATLKARWLPQIATGNEVVALAHDEIGMRDEAALPRTRLERLSDGGGRLYGTKIAVAAGADADAWIVTVRQVELANASAPGAPILPDVPALGAWLVPATAPGVTVDRAADVDGTPVARLRFDGTPVAAADELRASGLVHALQQVRFECLAAGCQQAVGAMDGMLAATLEYVKLRRQFGTAIGRFQAVQHRLVDMYARLELARAMADRAMALVADDAGAPLAASAVDELRACKLQVADACRLLAEQGVQLHGGIGMTDECAASHYFRHLLVLQKRQGDSLYHLRALSARVAAGHSLFS